MDANMIGGILSMLGNMGANQHQNADGENTNNQMPDLSALAGLAGLMGGAGGIGGITPTTYVCRFDENGRRQETYPVDRTMTEERKAQLLSEGYVEIPAEEWEMYVSNPGKNGTGMIRGEDGKPTDAPPYVPTKEDKLSTLKSEYESKKESLVKEYMTAMAYGDSDKQQEIQNTLKALDVTYKENCDKVEAEFSS